MVHYTHWNLSRRATASGILALTLWATLPVITVVASRIPPFEMMAITFCIAFLSGASGLLVYGRADEILSKHALLPWTVGSLAIFTYHACYFYAIATIAPAATTLIAYLWPLMVVLFSAARLGAGMKARHVMGALFGLFGTVLILRDRPIDEHLFSATGAWSGYAAAFSCAIVWAVYSLSNRKFCDASSTAMVSICGGVSLASALCHILFEKSLLPTWTELGALVALGLGPVGVAFLAWDFATKHGQTILLGSLAYLTPLMSTLLLVWVGLALPTANLVFATVFIVGGAVLAVGLCGSYKRRHQ